MKGCQADLNFLQIDLYLCPFHASTRNIKIKLKLSRNAFNTLDISRIFKIIPKSSRNF